MEPVLTAEQMRAADEEAIAGGVPGVVLMERAAYACATVACRMLGTVYGRRVVVACGKGNNGGDGIAAARHLAASGAAVDAFLLDEPTGDAAEHLRIARERGAGSLRIHPWDLGSFERHVERADLAIDAVFGTGFDGAPRWSAADAIGALNDGRGSVLAVDIPSGVAGVDGSVPGVAVRADVTVAIAALKIGHVRPPGAFHCGRVDVADIGIGVPAATVSVPLAADVAGVLPHRDPDTHKYRTGVVIVLAGSAGMSGAAILTATGALRAGAGLVVMGVARGSLEAVESACVEAVKIPLPETEGQLEAKAVDELADRLQQAGAVAVGPGIGRGPRAVALVERLLETDRPLVIDADGLNALAQLLERTPDLLRHREGPTILTPHTGEFARLLGRSIGDGLEDVRHAADTWGAVVHLKGRGALTASPDGRVWVNTTGNPGMATGGTGDVLTGVTGTLLAQGLDPAEAMWAAAFLHGRAGDVAARRKGIEPMTARDLADGLPEAFRRLAWDPPASGRIRTVLDDPGVTP